MLEAQGELLNSNNLSKLIKVFGPWKVLEAS